VETLPDENNPRLRNCKFNSSIFLDLVGYIQEPPSRSKTLTRIIRTQQAMLAHNWQPATLQGKDRVMPTTTANPRRLTSDVFDLVLPSRRVYRVPPFGHPHTLFTLSRGARIGRLVDLWTPRVNVSTLQTFLDCRTLLYECLLNQPSRPHTFPSPTDALDSLADEEWFKVGIPSLCLQQSCRPQAFT